MGLHPARSGGEGAAPAGGRRGRGEGEGEARVPLPGRGCGRRPLSARPGLALRRLHRPVPSQGRGRPARRNRRMTRGFPHGEMYPNPFSVP